MTIGNKSELQVSKFKSRNDQPSNKNPLKVFFNFSALKPFLQAFAVRKLNLQSSIKIRLKAKLIRLDDFIFIGEIATRLISLIDGRNEEGKFQIQFLSLD